MGGISSRVNEETLEITMLDLVSKLNNLHKEKGRLKRYLKDQLLVALNTYAIVLNQKYRNKKNTRKVQTLIDCAIGFLQLLPTQETSNVLQIKDKLQSIKQHLCDIDRNLKYNKIQANEYADLLRDVAAYSQQLESISAAVTDGDIKLEEKNVVSILLVELFNKAPLMSIVQENNDNYTILDNVLLSLICAEEDLKKLDTKNETASNKEHSEQMLEIIRSKVIWIHQIAEGLSQMLIAEESIQGNNENATYEQGASGCNPDISVCDVDMEHHNEKKFEQAKEQLLRMTKYWDELEENIRHTHLPVDSSLVDKMEEDIHHFLKDLKKVANENKEITEMKSNLTDKASKLNNFLKQMKHNNEECLTCLLTLSEIEQQIIKVVESNIPLQQKRTSLMNHMAAVSSINIKNDCVQAKKKELINRIDGLLVVETINHLNQMKRNLNHYKMYAQQFPYPKRSAEYEEKRKDISSLTAQLKTITTGDVFVDDIIQKVYDSGVDILGILKKKAELNEGTVKCLEQLENIKNEVDEYKKTSLKSVTILQSFNFMRGKICMVDNFHRRILAKKQEVYSIIQNYEDFFYDYEFLKDLKEFKDLANKYENEVLQFLYSKSHKLYSKKLFEIMTLRENIRILATDNGLLREVKGILMNTIDAIVNLLKETAEENEKRNHDLDCLNHINNKLASILCKPNLELEKDLKFYEQYKKKISSMKTNTKKVEILNIITKIEANLVVGEYKIRLPQLKKCLKQHKEEMQQFVYPMQSDMFKEKLSEIIHLKDYLDDLPETDIEMDDCRKILLKRTYEVVKCLDVCLAERLFSQHHSENILDLQRHFDDFDLNSLGISRESEAFVEIIRTRARNFEDKVNHYFGSNDSIDYYVIHENLMRLLEELDKLGCRDNKELLAVTVDTMNYIKTLIEQLDMNASINN